MKVLFDTNVVLDVLLAREAHLAPAVRLFSLVDAGVLLGCLGATTLTTIHYLTRRQLGVSRADAAVSDLLAIFDVAPVERSTLVEATTLGFRDFEDAVLHAAALRFGADAIVTRNLADFRDATLPVYSPLQLVAALTASGR